MKAAKPWAGSGCAREPLADPVEAEAAQHPPQLEGAEAAPELEAVVHQVDRVLAASERSGQVLRDQ
jgi:hypothetical protein